MGGAWVFPGGGVKPIDARTPPRTARRELEEEAERRHRLRRRARAVLALDHSGRGQGPLRHVVLPRPRPRRRRGRTRRRRDRRPPLAALRPRRSRRTAARELVLVFPTIKHLEQLAGSTRSPTASRRRPTARSSRYLPRVVGAGADARVLLPGDANCFARRPRPPAGPTPGRSPSARLHTDRNSSHARLFTSVVGRRLSTSLLAVALISLALAGVGDRQDRIAYDGPDTLVGTSRPTIYGEAGNDQLSALGGPDYLEAGPAPTTRGAARARTSSSAAPAGISCAATPARPVYAGHGNDRVLGGADGDSLRAGSATTRSPAARARTRCGRRGRRPPGRRQR